jgi:hypothetical protein
MIPLAKRASPAAIAALRQATAAKPKRKRASDGLLPSKAHVKQNPNSDHNSGLAVDITHDPKKGIDCAFAFIKLQKDKRVKYLIFNGKIWSPERGNRNYTGSNPHKTHLHISIKNRYKKDTSPWFPWLPKAKVINKVKAVAKSLPKKKEAK